MALFEETGYYQPKEDKSNKQEPEGKKHTIKSRTKAATAFALRQVRDAVVAGGVILSAQAITALSTPVGVAAVGINPVATIPTIGLIAIGAASFMGSKMVFKGVKKHTIKKREKGKASKKSIVAKTTIAVAAPLTALLVGGYTPAAIVGIGVGAVTLAHKLHSRKKKKQEEQEVRTK